ncbi:hypothetical protein [Nonlabens ulvanivorans]|uniref:Lipoprotein n=2 Tax=Nonlabens ulvanivorans TaxID=906888 RepID=A0ABX5E4U2_NONUL|nr:hypothetical protein [Nonlabens ulvanivorans]PRX12566.1 hypothetical protein LY02_02632 [Nonlabens ulvanivorans]
MKHLTFLILILFLVSCKPLFCSWELGYTQMESQPDFQSTLGLYKLSEKSKEYLNMELSGWTTMLELDKDGILNYKNGDVTVKTGTWRISYNESYNCVIDMEERVVPFAIKDGKYGILITIGDGDECKGIVYEKQIDKSN